MEGLDRPKKGDWVRHMHNGCLVIGEVAYVLDAQYTGQGEWVAILDNGQVTQLGALEVRQPYRGTIISTREA